MFRKFGQYSLTKPITKNGEAFYFTALKNLANGRSYNAQNVRNRDLKYFTFQALREAGLIITENRYYHITDKGRAYIEYYSKNSNPTVTFFEQYTPSSKNTDIKVSCTTTLSTIPTTTNSYKVEVKRTNGASIYSETYTFDNKTDAKIAKEIMNKADNTSATLV